MPVVKNVIFKLVLRKGVILKGLNMLLILSSVASLDICSLGVVNCTYLMLRDFELVYTYKMKVDEHFL